MSASQLTVITGPSGVGKGTLVRLLLARHPHLQLSVSATTRKPRPGEREGEDYIFLSQADFQTMIDADQFLEWAEYADHYYGTPRSTVEEQINQGKQVILEIEVVGARKIKQAFPTADLVFILPPSLAELEHRLKRRGKDSPSAMHKRLEQAKRELAASHEFDHQIVNDDLEKALKALEAIILA